jgi:hypothetical protein
MAEEKTITTKVKMLREVNFKGAGFAKGATVELEPHIAARLISDGNAEAVTAEKAEKAPKK